MENGKENYSKRNRPAVKIYFSAGIKEKVSFTISSSIFIGLLPIAPGTWGTIFSALLSYWLMPQGWVFTLIIILSLITIGIFAIDILERHTGFHDDPRIVIDEVAGFTISIILLPKTWIIYLIAFMAFRLFDIWKPYPIGSIDRKLRGGVGVIADDVVAGIYANILTRIISLIFL